MNFNAKGHTKCIFCISNIHFNLMLEWYIIIDLGYRLHFSEGDNTFGGIHPFVCLHSPACTV